MGFTPYCYKIKTHPLSPPDDSGHVRKGRVVFCFFIGIAK